METVTIQKLEKISQDNFHVAQCYYSILSTINNLHLTEREIQLIAFSTIRGSISYATVREEFCSKYHSSFPTINNIISKLKKLHIFIKKGKQIIVNPMIVLDFSKPLILQITLTMNNNDKQAANKHAFERAFDQAVESEVEHS